MNLNFYFLFLNANKNSLNETVSISAWFQDSRIEWEQV